MTISRRTDESEVDPAKHSDSLGLDSMKSILDPKIMAAPAKSPFSSRKIVHESSYSGETPSMFDIQFLNMTMRSYY